MKTEPVSTSTLSLAAKDRMLQTPGEPWMMAGWRDAVFLHFSVAASRLQPFVPFELELHDGKAWVSCVAFTMIGLRPRMGATFLLKPIATHEFLNVRTYVRHQGESGIFFLAEWLPNPLSVKLGPAMFGLPYRHGRLRYEHVDTTALSGVVSDFGSNAALSYRANARPEALGEIATQGGLNELLFERYTAFTDWHGIKRLFRVWHPPWETLQLEATLHAASLLSCTGNWIEAARFEGAHFARGFDEVWMSLPHFL